MILWSPARRKIFVVFSWAMVEGTDEKWARIWFRRKLNLSSSIDNATFVHEIFHLAKSRLEYKGITLSDDSEEAFAYYLDWLVRTLGPEVQK